MISSPARSLVFLKLGGSLISDKRHPGSFRASVVARIGREIHEALRASPGLRILLAHGGGGFAHFPAQRFRTRQGWRGGGGWKGFAETRRGVLETNRRVLHALARANLYPVLVSPCAGLVAEAGAVKRWDIAVIRALLQADQMPMIHGDAVVDRTLGFTILSTEELFLYLAPRLRPCRIVLASDVEGVYPGGLCSPRGEIVPRIDHTNIADVREALRRPSGRTTGRRAWDVTGGIRAKVNLLFDLVRRVPGLEARIVSGLRPTAVRGALLGEQQGTLIRCAGTGRSRK